MIRRPREDPDASWYLLPPKCTALGPVYRNTGRISDTVLLPRRRWTMRAVEPQKSDVSIHLALNLGVRGRLLLAFFGISAFAVLAAALGIYAFREVGDRLELIDIRVPQVVSSMEISRSVDRLIASAPALLAATTPKERDEVSNRMRPEIDRLIIKLNEVARGEKVDEAVTIQTLVGSLRSNLTELEELIGLRLKIREHLATLLNALFQANKEAERLFAPWLDVM